MGRHVRWIRVQFGVFLGKKGQCSPPVTDSKYSSFESAEPALGRTGDQLKEKWVSTREASGLVDSRTTKPYAGTLQELIVLEELATASHLTVHLDQCKINGRWADGFRWQVNPIWSVVQ